MQVRDTVRDAATSVDERGKRLWRERGLESGTGKRRFGYLVSAVVDLVLLAVVSGPLVWNIPFLTSAFVAPLAIIELSLAASAVAEFTFFAYDAAWYRHLAHLGLSVIAFAATYSLLTVFPFEFSNAVMSDAMRIALIVALFGIAIGAVVQALQFLFGWLKG